MGTPGVEKRNEAMNKNNTYLTVCIYVDVSPLSISGVKVKFNWEHILYM